MGMGGFKIMFFKFLDHCVALFQLETPQQLLLLKALRCLFAWGGAMCLCVVGEADVRDVFWLLLLLLGDVQASAKTMGVWLPGVWHLRAICLRKLLPEMKTWPNLCRYHCPSGIVGHRMCLYVCKSITQIITRNSRHTYWKERIYECKGKKNYLQLLCSRVLIFLWVCERSQTFFS